MEVKKVSHEQARKDVSYWNTQTQNDNISKIRLNEYIDQQEAKDNKPTTEEIIKEFKNQYGWDVNFNGMQDEIRFNDNKKVCIVEYDRGAISIVYSITPKLAMMIAKFYGAKS